jgi:uncharacterized membrane protein
VTKRKISALAALSAFAEEQREREKRANELRLAAALELGLAVLDAAGVGPDLEALRRLVVEAVQTSANGPARTTAKHA